MNENIIKFDMKSKSLLYLNPDMLPPSTFPTQWDGNSTPDWFSKEHRAPSLPSSQLEVKGISISHLAFSYLSQISQVSVADWWGLLSSSQLALMGWRLPWAVVPTENTGTPISLTPAYKAVISCQERQPKNIQVYCLTVTKYSAPKWSVTQRKEWHCFYLQDCDSEFFFSLGGKIDHKVDGIYSLFKELPLFAMEYGKPKDTFKNSGSCGEIQLGGNW